MDDEKRIIRGPQDSDNRILVPSERVLSRNSGCWNCIHMRDATEFWFGDKSKGTLGQRQVNLNRAVSLAVGHPLGENHPKVVNIKRMVQLTDEAVARKAMVRCAGGGRNAQGEQSDLYANSFMCERWTGAAGASVARGGERINDLPEEMREKIDGPESKAKLDELAETLKKDEGES